MTQPNSRLRRYWTGAALFWFHFCLAVGLPIALLNAAALLFPPGPEREVNPPGFVLKAMARAFPDLSAEERLELRREHEIRFAGDPLVLFREEPRAGRFVTVDPKGFRVGTDQGRWPPSPEAYNLFLLGGSTAFGYGVPDEHTISSYLQPMLPAVGGREVRVYNFGRGAYESSMERLLFEKLVLMGPPMDLAIFLDGVNDFSDAVHPPLVSRALTRRGAEHLDSPVLALLHWLPMTRFLEPEPAYLAIQREVKLHRDSESERAPDAPEPADPIGVVIERYVANKTAIEAVAAVHDIDVLFIWQPAPTYKYDLAYHTYRKKSFGVGEQTRRGYPRMRRYADEYPLGDNFLWCADIQQGVKELLYVDRFHYTPRMSERVARCIADGLLARGYLEAQ
jgi:hypothetical protein